MNRVAAFSAQERHELFSMTAAHMGIGSVAIIEKDFWVCWTLKQLFEHNKLSKLLIFKGGTSLSKVFGLITRFSEDVDLVLDWRQVTRDHNPMDDRSKRQQSKINETLNDNAITYIAETMMPWLKKALGSHCELDIKADEKDQGHVVRVRYPKIENPIGILPYIQLEIGPLASWLPHSKHKVTPYAAEHFPQLFNEPHSMVQAIDAERTFWEKATILHQEANRPEDSPTPTRYSRHYYDLFMMAADASLKASALRKLELLNDVVLFKKKFYPRNWANYDDAVTGSLKLVPPVHVLTAMQKDYDAMQEMIFGDYRPTFDEIITSLGKLETEINHP
ncbi:nucleotidyl transferase AbiEii/AbiGii toxin family protein [Persicirhabdus sediminis]|uniref:Nucleotidyl transferase AbiEii/AbiGii toxin family protein n=1 Tax=Persicirhabdus sediminis TaxID=454144 RepID=A0A8J7MDP1_9BACT|nr:nucleotidyl transferase AbiEii/AbiGii toxin family protein [Persicirhabdus sediminis]MBK1791346.1 nucleotidyl transferase AbiEii/AbiGii toxin family protein [Persicirhabdus sediminis]